MTDIKLSNHECPNNSGESLGRALANMMDNIGKKNHYLTQLFLWSKIFIPKIRTLSVLYKSRRKKSGKGAVRARKVFAKNNYLECFVPNEDFDDIIEIVETRWTSSH